MEVNCDRREGNNPNATDVDDGGANAAQDVLDSRTMTTAAAVRLRLLMHRDVIK